MIYIEVIVSPSTTAIAREQAAAAEDVDAKLLTATGIAGTRREALLVPIQDNISMCCAVLCCASPYNQSVN